MGQGWPNKLQIVVPWKGQHRMMWVIAEAVSFDDQTLAAECATDLPIIVTLDHDWSTGCSELVGIEGLFGEMRLKNFYWKAVHSESLRTL
jgi:hypothetical protein